MERIKKDKAKGEKYTKTESRGLKEASAAKGRTKPKRNGYREAKKKNK